MKHETDFQSEIIAAWKETCRPAWAKKLSNSWTSGIPDLLLVAGDSFIVEIKLIEDMPSHMGTRIKFKHPLTPVQDNTLIDLRKAGANAGWMVIYRSYSEDAFFFGHSDRDRPTCLEFINGATLRKRGAAWDQTFSALRSRLMNYEQKMHERAESE